MAKITYSMGVSLDGFVAAPGGEIDWTVPDEELHRFHNERVRELAGHLLGRRLYEAMLYWETVEQNPSAAEVELEFAQIWRATPRYVASRTLSAVEGDATLLEGDVAGEVAALKQRVDGEIGVGGAELAASLVELDLIDEYAPVVYPVVLGAGTPFLPPLERRLELELVETRRFDHGVVFLNYRRASEAG